MDGQGVSAIAVEHVDGGAAIITLDRPDRLNALTPELAPLLLDTLTTLDRDASCRVVILTGRGRAFCAGVDLKAAAARFADNPPTALDRMAMQETFAEVVLRLRGIRQPTIAAVNGPAVGIGMALALTCDIRLLADSAEFILGALRLGITAGELGISYHLPRLIGMSRAAGILLTGRPIAADEALEIGLGYGIYSSERLREAALDHAKGIATNYRYAVEHTKQLMWANLDAPSLDVALKLENHAQVLGGVTSEFRDAVQRRRDEIGSSQARNAE